MISVIVPVYNSSLHLERCIDSILNQSYGDFELLLINDGSTDDSGLICDKYSLQDKRVRTFHQTNKGVSAARNHGLCVSNGEWITFIDSDDYIKPDYFVNFNPLLLNKYDLVIQGIITTDQSGHIINRLEYPNINISLHLGGGKSIIINSSQTEDPMPSCTTEASSKTMVFISKKTSALRKMVYFFIHICDMYIG
jgi:glycosyltransferase involved in cell wall biosynthesis